MDHWLIVRRDEDHRDDERLHLHVAAAGKKQPLDYVQDYAKITAVGVVNSSVQESIKTGIKDGVKAAVVGAGAAATTASVTFAGAATKAAVIGSTIVTGAKAAAAAAMGSVAAAPAAATAMVAANPIGAAVVATGAAVAGAALVGAAAWHALKHDRKDDDMKDAKCLEYHDGNSDSSRFQTLKDAEEEISRLRQQVQQLQMENRKLSEHMVKMTKKDK